MKLLIVRLSALGDIIHSLPAAAILKRSIPSCELAWLVEPAGKQILQNNPLVDRLICFDKKTIINELLSVSGFIRQNSALRQLQRELREFSPELTVDMQGLMKSSLLSFCSGAKHRFGFKGTREGAEFLLTDSLSVGDYFSESRHVVDLNIDLALHILHRLGLSDSIESKYESKESYINDGINFILPNLTESDKLEAESFLPANFLKDKPLVALVPGTTWESKIWPLKSWVDLAQKLLNELGAQVVLVGGRAETETNKQLADSDKRLINLTNKTSLAVLQHIFSLSQIVVGADTGPIHLAAALSKPKVLAIFGSTPKGRNGPYGKECHSISLNLSCQPCFKKVCPLGTLACLENLSAEQVFESLQKII